MPFYGNSQHNYNRAAESWALDLTPVDEAEDALKIFGIRINSGLVDLLEEPEPLDLPDLRNLSLNDDIPNSVQTPPGDIMVIDEQPVLPTGLCSVLETGGSGNDLEETSQGYHGLLQQDGLQDAAATIYRLQREALQFLSTVAPATQLDDNVLDVGGTIETSATVLHEYIDQMPMFDVPAHLLSEFQLISKVVDCFMWQIQLRLRVYSCFWTKEEVQRAVFWLLVFARQKQLLGTAPPQTPRYILNMASMRILWRDCSQVVHVFEQTVLPFWTGALKAAPPVEAGTAAGDFE